MDQADIAVHTVLAAEDTGQVGNDAIKTACGIEVGLGLWFSTSSSNFILKLFNKGRYQRVFAWEAAILTAMEVIVVDAMVDEFAPLDAKKESVVRFIKVKNTEAVDLDVVWFFEYHHINNLLPSFVGVPSAEGVVQKVNLGLEKGETFGLEKTSSFTI